MSDGKIDPLDIGALERSVNDSANRVSAIWLSFVAFSAYLAAAASNISHRQIFLEEAIKLPTINIDLPLAASAILLPLLFVIYHVYVLLQVVLLARTAAAYNKAVERAIPDAEDSTHVRQRLANTLFAQLFAGSPREREGIVGGLLRAMVWITLAIAPVLVLLLFQVKFLPYQSAAVTWSHRILFALDLLAILLLWSAAVNVQRDVTWQALIQGRIGATFAAIAVLISIFPLTYPGEFHTAWVKTQFYDNEYNGRDTAECRMPKVVAAILPTGFDRLALSGTALVDVERLGRIEKAASAQKPHEGERTRVLAGRNFNCAVLTGTDLRRADFSGAALIGAILDGADLRGARFTNAVLRNAAMDHAQLDDADLRGADLQRADIASASAQRARFDDARLERASLSRADLTGASLGSTKLQGARLVHTNLEGAHLYGANLTGADLDYANLYGATVSVVGLRAATLKWARVQGADLSASKLSGARLTGARLQGAYFESAAIDGADLIGAELQGANLHQAVLTRSTLSGAYLWRSLWRAEWSQNRSTCDDAHVVNPNFHSILATETSPGQEPKEHLAATADALRSFVESVRKRFPKDVQKGRVFTLNQFLAAQPDDETARQSEAMWRACAEKAVPEREYDKQLAAYLAGLACKPDEDQPYLAEAIYSRWIADEGFEPAEKRILARGLLGLDGTACPGAAGVRAWVKEKLREAATE